MRAGTISPRMDEAADTFDSAFSKAVDLGNRLAGKDKEADLWDIADGLLAQQPGELTFAVNSRLLADVVTVPEEILRTTELPKSAT